MERVDLRRTSINGALAEPPDAELQRLVTMLIERRRQLGLSQTELGKRIGTSQRTVSQLETLTHEPKVSTLISWARAVGVRLAWADTGNGHAAKA